MSIHNFRYKVYIQNATYRNIHTGNCIHQCTQIDLINAIEKAERRIKREKKEKEKAKKTREVSNNE